tara:strand:+ start:286 stop:390 length:105 start_codon:yes stop_codon:yes gene_type:complete
VALELLVSRVILERQELVVIKVLLALLAQVENRV